eukprot:758335-Hanusia_phi.AAC.1
MSIPNLTRRVRTVDPSMRFRQMLPWLFSIAESLFMFIRLSLLSCLCWSLLSYCYCCLYLCSSPSRIAMLSYHTRPFIEPAKSSRLQDRPAREECLEVSWEMAESEAKNS